MFRVPAALRRKRWLAIGLMSLSLSGYGSGMEIADMTQPRSLTGADAVSAIHAPMAMTQAPTPEDLHAMPVPVAMAEAGVVDVAPPVVEAPAPLFPPVARVDGVELLSPVLDPLAIGFHEGAWGCKTLEPVGIAIANPRGVALPDDVHDHDHAHDYVVMPSRRRGTNAKSAMDVAVEAGQPVYAPVTGTVVQAQRYALYGRYRDNLVFVRPDAAPHLIVEVFHLTGNTVAKGDRVEAGVTVIAEGARQLPFNSQVDRWSGARTPHVHLQVTRG